MWEMIEMFIYKIEISKEMRFNQNIFYLKLKLK